MKLMAFLLWPALACVALLVLVALFQDRLLYFPAHAVVGDMASERLAAWPTVPEFRGLVAEPVGLARGTAVVFHGNAGHAAHRGFYAQALTGLGLRVVLAEYPGYGPRSGALGERSLVDDAEQTLLLAHRLHGAPLLVVGESLGSGVAAAAAARQADKVAGLLLITPWDRLANVAAFHYPWLPVKWLLRDRYDSAANLASFSRPVLVAVAERDDIVPARLGITLYNGLGGFNGPSGLPERKRLELISLAGHNDWVMHIDEAWWRRATAFLLADQPTAPP